MFYSIAAVTLVSAVGAITMRSPVYCAIWVALTLLGVAGLFFFQGAQFLGVATVVVYAGAILVTMLFVLMLAGLIGLIVAMVLNIFLASGTLSLVISIVGIVIFTALTAYDVQRIQNGDLAAWTGSMEKGAVYGALSLYLNFINLFLFFLRLFGG